METLFINKMKYETVKNLIYHKLQNKTFLKVI